MIPWLLIAIAVLLVILGIIAVIMTRKKRRPTDYYNLFIIGIIWLPIGILLRNYVLVGLGLVLVIVGLVNKKKWEQNRIRWSDLDKSEKKIRLWIMGGLGILVLLGLIVLLLSQYF